jgi:outer membrane protein OmpA-like peptidoglycan-associated protein
MRRGSRQKVEQPARRFFLRSLLTVLAFANLTVATTHVAAAESGQRPRIERLPDGRDAVPSEDSIYFGVASATLDADALQVIRRHIARLEANPQLYLTLVAHTDELGSTALEIAWGQDRLNVVLKLLEAARISQRRIRSINLGSEIESSEDCSDDTCRRLRRRIDFLFHR